MKIIHTADLHLDSCLEAHLSSFVAKERKKELLYNFERLIEYANSHDVDKIIIAGDLFDSERITVKTRTAIYDLINDNQNINFFYVTGNHEGESFVKQLASRPSNLKYFSHEFETLSYDGLDITGINYMDKYSYGTLRLNPDNFNILIMHGDVNTDISLDNLKNKNIDYLALGHIHKYTKGTIDERGIYVYPGCLEARGFDEVGPKGFVLLDVDGKNVKTEFVPFAKREAHSVEVNITDLDNYQDIRKNVNLKLNDINEKDMLEVVLTGYYKLDLVKQNDLLASSLNEIFYFAKVKDNSKLKIDPKDFENDISLKGEFVRNVLASDLPDEDKTQIIEYGVKALMKEEI